MKELEYNGYKVVSDNYGFKEIKAVGRGSVPMPLRGKFTSELEAKNAIDRLLQVKVPKDAKAD